MNNAQLDSFVTSFVVNNGLTPQSLSIDSLSASPLTPYSPGGTGESNTNSSSSGDISSSSTTTSTTGQQHHQRGYQQCQRGRYWYGHRRF